MRYKRQQDMDNTIINNLQKEALKRKFKGKKRVKCRVRPIYQSASDREYQRVMISYINIARDTLKERLPNIMALYKESQRADARFDSAYDFCESILAEFNVIREKLNKRLEKINLENTLDKTSKDARNRVVKEWKRLVKQTLGIDLYEDYYMGDFYRQMLAEWTVGNAVKIKSIPTQMLDRMAELVLEAHRQGMTIKTLQKKIQKEFNVTKQRARILARDQMSTLNAQITKAQQQDAGVEYYIWSTSKDQRVRECHGALEGKMFSWDNPPEMWYKTKSKGVVMTGKRCHPGEDYCCRCCALPVFD